MEIVKPRSEIEQHAQWGEWTKLDIAAWLKEIEAILPAHVYRNSSMGYQWTNPSGCWTLQTSTTSHYRGGRVIVTSPGGTLELADYAPDYVRCVLQVLGAL
jgi:hypothetical protein